MLHFLGRGFCVGLSSELQSHLALYVIIFTRGKANQKFWLLRIGPIEFRALYGDNLAGVR